MDLFLCSRIDSDMGFSLHWTEDTETVNLEIISSEQAILDSFENALNNCARIFFLRITFFDEPVYDF